MASSTIIPVSEYLATSYRPDCDYVDGQVKERNVGEQPHAGIQALLARIFGNHLREWHIRVFTEQRVQTSSEHFRIPDVCVVRKSEPAGAIVQTAPLICIEILSRNDTLLELQQRVDDYVALGVENIWIIDPLGRRAYLASNKGFQEIANGELVVAGTPIHISLAELFADLDEMLAQG